MYEIELYDEIGGDGWFLEGVRASDIRKEIAKAGDDEPILLRIDSPGGSVFEATSILSNLSDHPGGFHARVDGLAASAASLIAVKAQSLQMSEGSYLMIHNPYAIAEGDASKFLKVAAKLQSHQDRYVQAYAQASGAKLSTVEAWMADEKWFSDEEAVSAGLATSIVDTHARELQIAARFRGVFSHTPDGIHWGKPTEAAKPKPQPRSTAPTLKRVDLAALSKELSNEIGEPTNS